MRSIKGVRHVSEVVCLAEPCDWVFWNVVDGREVRNTTWGPNLRAATAHSRKTGHPVKIYFEQTITIRRRRDES